MQDQNWVIRQEGAAGSGAFGAPRAFREVTDASVQFAGHDLGVVEVSVVPDAVHGRGDLIGQDILSRWCVEYRLADGAITVGAPQLGVGVDVSIGARGHVVADVQWDHTRRARAVLDTGASVTVVHEGFVARHPELFDLLGTTEGTDADGTTLETPLLSMAPMTLLGSLLPATKAVSVDLSAAMLLADSPFDLILGWPVLSQGIFTIDHAKGLARHTF